MYEVCERLEVLYTFGLTMNRVFQSRSESLLKHADERYQQTGEPQRLFCDFWHQARTWPAQRRVVVKVEVHSKGPNRRAVVTNRPGVFVLPDAVYEAYVDRGESEKCIGDLVEILREQRAARSPVNAFKYVHKFSVAL